MLSLFLRKLTQLVAVTVDNKYFKIEMHVKNETIFCSQLVTVKKFKF